MVVCGEIVFVNSLNGSGEEGAVSLEVWDLTALRPKGQRVKQVKLVVGGVRGVTCDGPGIPETGRSGDSLQGDNREGKGFVFSFFMTRNKKRFHPILCCIKTFKPSTGLMLLMPRRQRK